MGGVKRKLFSRSGDNIAPGLKLKSGNADRACLSAFSAENPKLKLGVSMADMGRRPVALEKDEGADAEPGGWAGKTNGGFGGGSSAWALQSSDWDPFSEFIEAANRSAGLSNAGPEDGPDSRSGPNVVAIFSSAAQRQSKRWTTVDGLIVHRTSKYSFRDRQARLIVRFERLYSNSILAASKRLSRRIAAAETGLEFVEMNRGELADKTDNSNGECKTK
jgi:hypothetical protein